MMPRRRTRSIARRWIACSAVALAGLTASCSDSSAPTATESSSAQRFDPALAAAMHASFTLPNSFVAQGLLRQKPLAEPVTVTKVIPSGGGKIDVPGTDFSLVIPRGAFLGSSMTFTVTALAGYTVAYDFQPHGSVFLVPLTFVQHTGHTNLAGLKPPAGFTSGFAGAYFPNSSMVDPISGLSVVTELLPASLEFSWTGDQITFPIHHFSGYMIATGRQSNF